MKAPVDSSVTVHEGDWYWVPSKLEGYLPARLVTQNKNSWDLEAEDGRQFQVTKKKLPLEKVFWSHLKRLVTDLVMLDAMSRQLICHNLKKRFQNNEIYTAIGSILISINPYKWLPLYTPEVMERFQKQRSRQVASQARAPHMSSDILCLPCRECPSKA